MNKKYACTLIGALVIGQTAIAYYGIDYETKKITTRIESIKLEKINEKNVPTTNNKVTKVTYKYKKKKDFTNIENSISNMRKQKDNFHGGGDLEKLSQPARIAKVLSGKLLISQN